MARRYAFWTSEEDERLIHLRDVENKFFKEIDAIMNKSGKSSGERDKLLMRRRGDAPPKPAKTSRTLLRDHIRAHEGARITAGYTSITAAFFGDPPPGRSALDKKSAGVSAC